MPSNWVCKYASPGIGCGLYEMIVLSIGYLALAVICLSFIIQNIRKKKTKSMGTTFSWLFWLSMIIWLLYRSVIFMVPFNYSVTTLRIYGSGIPTILFLLPFSLLVLLVLEFLFSYLHFDANLIWFFRIVFIVFLVLFILSGLVLSFVDTDSHDPGATLYLWNGCLNIIVSVFVYGSIRTLVKLQANVEDIQGVLRHATIYTVCFSGLFFIRAIYNVLHYFDLNPISDWYDKEIEKSDLLTVPSRIYQFFFFLIFELCAAALAMKLARILDQYDTLYGNPDALFFGVPEW